MHCTRPLYLGGVNFAFLVDFTSFIPNFELVIKKYILDRCVQRLCMICTMWYLHTTGPHLVVRCFDIVGNEITAIPIDGVQLPQFAESLHHSNNIAVETWIDVTPNQSIHEFLFPGRPPELEMRNRLRLLLLCLTRCQTKSISLGGEDLAAEHGLIPSAHFLIKFKCLETHLGGIDVETNGKGGHTGGHVVQRSQP